MNKNKKAETAQDPQKPKRKYVRKNKADESVSMQDAPKPKRKYVRKVKVDVPTPKHEAKPKRKYVRKVKVDVPVPKHVESVVTPEALPQGATIVQEKAHYAARRAQKYAVDRRTGRWTKL